MKKVLVTGATGFIGNYVIKELIKNNVSVIATSLSPAKAEKKDWFKNVQYIPFDIKEASSEKDFYQYFNTPDVLIHLAWEGLPNYKEPFHILENLLNHISFLKNIISNGVKDVTVVGTCFEYGMQDGELTETMPAMPANPYAQAKNELRKYLEHLKEDDPFSLKWLRLFYMFGDGQNPKSLISQLDAALLKGDETFDMSGGAQVRDFLPVETVAKYIVATALQKQTEGIINICSNQPITVKDFVLNYLKQKNKTIQLNLGVYPYPDFEPFSFWGNNAKLKTIINE